MEVLYRSVWKDDSEIAVRVCPIVAIGLHFRTLLNLRPILRMNPFQELLPRGTGFLRAVPVNAKNLFRPEQSAGPHIPGPASHVGQTLPFGKIKLASSQLLGVAAELFFRRFALLNIQTRSIPLDDVAVCIAKGHFPVEHPAGNSIRSTDASFVLEDFSCCEAGPPLVQDPLDII